jgi:hypothetical protein
MDIRIITNPTELAIAKEIAAEFYEHMVKGVADVEKDMLALGGEYHMDSNNVLIENGSLQENLWGFNLYFDKPEEERLEYTSLINIRPKQNNFDMHINDSATRDKIKQIVDKLII